LPAPHFAEQLGDNALPSWITDAVSSVLASFGRASRRRSSRCRRSLDPTLVERQTEGQITKLKLVLRQMYGRGKLELLRARFFGPA
jgi:transposase